MPRPNLPPDPEKMNPERASWAEAAIQTFELQTRSDREDALCDLLADLAHWCDHHNENMADSLRRAMYHYDDETSHRGRQFAAVRIEG